MPFQNPIVAGTALVRQAINSPDYVPGVSGWAIKRDGTVEFNSGTFRGDLEIGGVPPNPRMEILTGADLPAELIAFYGAGSVVSGQLLYSDAHTYRYTVLLQGGSGTIAVVAGWGIRNSSTLAQEVWEDSRWRSPAHSAGSATGALVYTGQSGNPYNAPTDVTWEDQSNLRYAATRLTLTNQVNSAMTGAPAALVNGVPTILAGTTINFTSALASAAQPCNWIAHMTFDFDVTVAAGAGTLCQGLLNFDGAAQAPQAFAPLNVIARGTYSQAITGQIADRAAHTFALVVQKAVAGGTAVAHAVHTTLTVTLTESLGL